jgi:hypothetical protein
MAYLMVRLACDHCPRHDRKETLIAQFGGGVLMPDLTSTHLRCLAGQD